MATTWIDREPEDWEDEIPGKTAWKIEQREEMVNELAHDPDYQDRFILEEPGDFMLYLRTEYPEAVYGYIMDRWVQLTDWIKEETDV